MPLESYRLAETLKQKIDKRIASLVKDGIIAGIDPEATNYQIFFCMAIQFVPKRSGKQFAFGKPEGVRIFICVGRRVKAATDFIFKDQGLKFSHIYQGPPLVQLVKTINKLKRSYAKSKDRAHLEFIQFLFTRSQFIALKSGRSRIFYRNTGSKLAKITLDEMKNEIEPILKDPPQFEK